MDILLVRVGKCEVCGRQTTHGSCSACEWRTLQKIRQAVRDGTYPDRDPVRVAVTVERMLEEGRY